MQKKPKNLYYRWKQQLESPQYSQIYLLGVKTTDKLAIPATSKLQAKTSELQQKIAEKQQNIKPKLQTKLGE